MTTTYHAIPAAVLDALGGMMHGDAPVLMLCGDEVDLYHPLDPRCVNEPADIPDAMLLLPQSAPALAAVLHRAEVQRDADLNNNHAVLHQWRCIEMVSDALRYPDQRYDWHRFATRACHLAEHAAGQPEGTWTPREVTL